MIAVMMDFRNLGSKSLKKNNGSVKITKISPTAENIPKLVIFIMDHASGGNIDPGWIIKFSIKKPCS